MAKINGALNNIIVRLPKVKYVLVVGNYFLSGVKYGYGKCFLVFYNDDFSAEIISEKVFLDFLKKLGKEAIKNENVWEWN